MDTDSAALLIALTALALSFYGLYASPTRGPEGPPGPQGATPSVDAIADRVVELLDPRAGEAVLEMGSRWPVDRVKAPGGENEIDERQFRSRGTFLLGLFLEAEQNAYHSFLVIPRYKPDLGNFEQLDPGDLARSEVVLGMTEHALYVVKDRYGEPRVIR